MIELENIFGQSLFSHSLVLNECNLLEQSLLKAIIITTSSGNCNQNVF